MPYEQNSSSHRASVATRHGDAFVGVRMPSMTSLFPLESALGQVNTEQTARNPRHWRLLRKSYSGGQTNCPRPTESILHCVKTCRCSGDREIGHVELVAKPSRPLEHRCGGRYWNAPESHGSGCGRPGAMAATPMRKSDEAMKSGAPYCGAPLFL